MVVVATECVGASVRVCVCAVHVGRWLGGWAAHCEGWLGGKA